MYDKDEEDYKTQTCDLANRVIGKYRAGSAPTTPCWPCWCSCLNAGTHTQVSASLPLMAGTVTGHPEQGPGHARSCNIAASSSFSALSRGTMRKMQCLSRPSPAFLHASASSCMQACQSIHGPCRYMCCMLHAQQTLHYTAYKHGVLLL